MKYVLLQLYVTLVLQDPIMNEKINIRKIQLKDNPSIAQIIRTALEEYGEAQEGTVYTDPETDHIFEVFQKTPKCSYFIAEYNNEIIGGSGIYPTKNLPQGYAELVKIYLKKEYRGKGFGQILMENSINYAIKQGYSHLYLESFPSLKEAIQLYKKIGFKTISNRLGDSGHFACKVWMTMAL